jgi:hypothetical protein
MLGDRTNPVSAGAQAPGRLDALSNAVVEIEGALDQLRSLERLHEPK